MYICVCVNVCVCVDVCVYRVYLGISSPISQSLSLFTCVCTITCGSDSNLIAGSEPSNKRLKLDLNSCSQSADMLDHLKTDTRDDSEIHTGSYNADQTAIQT